MRKSLNTAIFVLSAGLTFVQSAPAQETPPAKTPPSPAASAPKATPAKKARAPAAKSATAPALTTQKEKASYALGMNIGRSLKKQSDDLDSASLVRGIKDTLAGGKMLLTDEEAQAALTDLQAAEDQKAREANMKEGEAFLADNKTKDGVVTLPSGLQYKVLTAGTGPKPATSDTVVCNYRDTFINGTEFDSSYKRGQPASFPVGQVIKGWTEALQLMPVGSKWQLFIPPDLAYGQRGAGGAIGPNATLVFEVELLSIQGK
ncbi:MAG TPA: FKBP-type peptidyl-prolyl cis-trans isomerase [Candidatus Acidoferrales bacterium]|nr:FKBP-type peptidyl-prolyl cis-trans isomerase [Candidatus Acidoferrales bacterium]